MKSKSSIAAQMIFMVTNDVSPGLDGRDHNEGEL